MQIESVHDFRDLLSPASFRHLRNRLLHTRHSNRQPVFGSGTGVREFRLRPENLHSVGLISSNVAAVFGASRRSLEITRVHPCGSAFALQELGSASIREAACRTASGSHAALSSWCYRRLLPEVRKPQFSFAHIRTEIALVSDKQDAGAMMDMAVVVDVDQLMVLHALLLNPGMKDRNEVFHADRCGIRREKLDTESVKFHHRAPRSARISWPR